jgi:hypothetical protein
MTRTIERVFGLIGAGLVTVALGSVAILVNNITLKEYQATFAPVFGKQLSTMSGPQQLVALKTLGAWFSVTVMLVLILVAVATLVVKKYPKRGGLLYLACGLVALFGSQLIAFPFAFLFFVAGVLCFMRKGGSSHASQHSKSNLTRV